MYHPTDLRQDIYTESGAPIKRIQIDISQDNSDLETNNRNVCEYFDCFNKAILTIEVQVGVLGIRFISKYYEQAEFILYRINTWNHKTPPVFIINTSDLTRLLYSELEQLKAISPRQFDKLVTEAVQTLLEGINKRYYHIAGLPYKVTWRFEP
jgi:hypothetical protein